MDASSLVESVQSANETELSRLGSSKGLYAVTGGEMDGDAIRAVTAAEAERASQVCAAWADDAADGAAAALFSDAAEDLAAQADGLAPAVTPSDHPVYDTLETFDGTDARLGGLLARSMLADALVGQAVGFFVGDADPSTADTFRGLRGTLTDHRDRAADLLTVRGDDAVESGQAAADETVAAAYDHYVETLESMGVKPKNVC
jgi:hypothetical protein